MDAATDSTTLLTPDFRAGEWWTRPMLSRLERGDQRVQLEPKSTDALPREEFIAKLETVTNVRVVRDEESSTGWTLTHDPCPGWETVPTW